MAGIASFAGARSAGAGGGSARSRVCQGGSPALCRERGGAHRTRRAHLFAATLALSLLASLALAAAPAKAAFPGQNGPIAFKKKIGAFLVSQTDIFTMDDLLFVPVNRTSTPDGLEYEPAFSPDGSKIAFTAGRSNGDIYVMKADGSEVTRLTTATSNEGQPSFSRNGKKIAFVSDGGGGSDIYTMDAVDADANGNGDNLRRLTNTNLRYESGPVFSPAGSKIAFASEKNIYTIKLDGTGEEQITNYTGNFDTPANPSWSPDATKIAHEQDEDIYVTDADATGEPPTHKQKLLTKTLRDDAYDPSFSPDGEQIAFVARPSGSEHDIYTMSAKDDDDNGDADGLLPPMNRTQTGRERETENKEPDWGVEPGTAAALPSADLALTQTDAPDPVAAGEEVTYEITVTNRGPATATDALVTDDLPAGTSYVSATPSHQGSCGEDAGRVSCLLGSIANGASKTVSIVARTSADGPLLNTAAVESSVDADPQAGNNSKTVETTVTSGEFATADLSLEQVDGPDPVGVDTELTYTLTVSNAGPDAASGVSVTDTLPASVDFVSASADQGSCSEADKRVSCSLGSLAARARATVTIVVRPRTVTKPEEPLSNSASVTSDSVDPDSANNADTETTTVRPVADLSLEQADSPDPIGVGEDLTYTLTVRNAGPQRARGITVTDTLPAGVKLISARSPHSGSSPCGAAPARVSCAVGELASGSSATVTIVVRPGEVGTLSNSASVESSAEHDPATGDNSDTETTTVVAGAPTVREVAPRGGPPAGGTKVELTGTGFSGASAVEFGDTPAASHEVISDTKLVAVTQAHGEGTVDVRVTNSRGSSTTVGRFQYGPWSETGPLCPQESTPAACKESESNVPPIVGNHTATRLNNGKVLVVGGLPEPGATALYDPASDSWSKAAPLPGGARPDHTATLLPSGKVLVAGGRAGGARVKTVEIYDPSINSWSPGAPLLAERSLHTATLISGSAAECGAHCGKVLIAGGAEKIPTVFYDAPTTIAAELYDPAAVATAAAAVPTAPPSYQRHGATATQLLGASPAECAASCGRVLVVGGDPDPDVTDVSEGFVEPHIPELYDHKSDGWAPTGPEQRRRYWGHSATLLSGSATECGTNCGKVLIAAGFSPYTATAQQAELYDPITGIFEESDNAPLAARDGHAAVQLPGGKVLIAGGAGAPSEAELFDPKDETWNRLLPMINPHESDRITEEDSGGGPNHHNYSATATVLSGSESECGSNCGKVLIAGGSTKPELFDRDAVGAPAPPRISIDDPSVTEGDSGTSEATFTVSLSGASAKPVAVDFATESDSARAPADFESQSGTLSFVAGETSKQVRVKVNGDIEAEPDERFRVKLSNPVNAALFDREGSATITDDDGTRPQCADGKDNDGDAKTDFGGQNPDPSCQSAADNSEGPEPPELTSVNPPSPSNDNNPKLIGSAEAGASVALHDNPACSGAPLASGSAAELAAPGITTPVPSDRTTTIYARATDAASNASGCSGSHIAYTEDSTAPDTLITAGPAGTVNSSTVVFSFSASEAGASFECRLDAGAWEPCSSPRRLSGLSAGAHTFSVRARDAAANTDASEATRSFTVAPGAAEDTTPPQTTIDSGPEGVIAVSSASFSYSSSEPEGASFECKLEGPAASAGYGDCSSPRTKTYSNLAEGSYTFAVRARDAAGNEDPDPATRSFRVATTRGGAGRQGGGSSGGGGGSSGTPAPATGSPGARAGGCLGFRAGVGARRLGPARLGLRRKAQRRALGGARPRARRALDRYCIAGGGALRIAYVRGRAGAILTTSRRYSLAGIRPGERTSALRRRLRGAASVRIGKSIWYIGSRRASRLIFRTRNGRVLEAGIADRRLTRRARAAKALLRSL